MQTGNNFSNSDNNKFYSDNKSYENIQNQTTEKLKIKLMEKDKTLIENSKIIKENEIIIENLKREIGNREEEIQKLKNNNQTICIQIKN